ncbi:MAG: SgcJ/EcaC family oxidoreductase [Burkholderiales bacterium]|nr:SgcJ/EcaC family oxidoreductase [Burkholderiales bacterium]
MRVVRLIMLCLSTCWLVPNAHAGTPEAEQGAVQAVMEWVEAYNSRDAARIAALYAPQAVFWGTRMQTLATEPAQILQYFTESARNPNLRVHIDDRQVRLTGHGGALVAGSYTVTDLRDGREVPTPARFTFVLEQRGDKWVILHHHSSRMPAQ